jgi:hypothetical protein
MLNGIQRGNKRSEKKTTDTKSMHKNLRNIMLSVGSQTNGKYGEIPSENSRTYTIL